MVIALPAARPLAAVGTVLSPVVLAFDAVTRRLSRPIDGDQEIEDPYAD